MDDCPSFDGAVQNRFICVGDTATADGLEGGPGAVAALASSVKIKSIHDKKSR
jgi:hypothetical protein